VGSLFPIYGVKEHRNKWRKNKIGCEETHFKVQILNNPVAIDFREKFLLLKKFKQIASLLFTKN